MTAKRLKELGFTCEHYYTCNDWGFGGKNGKMYTKGRFKAFKGKYFYRHMTPTRLNEYWIDDQEVTAKEFKERYV